MARGHRRKCKCCLKLFRPDPCNRRHQRYCSACRCRRASKAASQACWLGKPENQGYFRDPWHVARVRAWRSRNPGLPIVEATVGAEAAAIGEAVGDEGQRPTLIGAARPKAGRLLVRCGDKLTSDEKFLLPILTSEPTTGFSRNRRAGQARRGNDLHLPHRRRLRLRDHCTIPESGPRAH